MPDLGDLNPYPEEEPKLRRAWEDGYWAAQRGEEPAERHDFFDPIIRAFREGQEAALNENEKA